MKRALPYAAAAASGAAMALALPLAIPLVSLRELDPAGRLEPLAFVALVPAILAVRVAPSLRAALLRGLVAGLAYFYAAIWWVSHAMTAFGGLSFGFSFVALSLLVGYMAVHWAAAFGVSFALRARLGWPLALHLPLVWAALELVRNYLLTGFPWANLGYTQARTPRLAQLAALGGVYAIAALVVLVNAALAEALAARREGRPLPRRTLAVAAALVAAVALHGELRLRAVRARMAAAPTIAVGIVQPNIDQSVKNRARDRADYILSRLVPLTVEADRAGADLVAWPEATYPLYVPPGTRSFATRDSGLPPLSRAHLLMGAVTYETSRGPRGERVRHVGNVDFLLTPGLQRLGVYQKNHLVPFGEYVPLARYLGFLGQVVPSLAPAAPGSELTVLEFQPTPTPTSTPTSTSTSTPTSTPTSTSDPDLDLRPRPDAVGGRSRPPRAHDLLRRDLPRDQRRLRAQGPRARDPREPHERRLVRLLLRPLPVPRHRPPARHRGGQGGGAAGLRGRLGGGPADRRARAGRARGGAGRSGARAGSGGAAAAAPRRGASLARSHPLH